MRRLKWRNRQGRIFTTYGAGSVATRVLYGRTIFKWTYLGLA